MKKKQFEVTAYFEAPECDCGGVFDTRVGPVSLTVLHAEPIQAPFQCNKCGKVHYLYEPDFPGVKFRYGAEWKP